MKVKTITCPNCGHANNFLAEDCSQCGINFSKYYEELEKAEALRRHIEEQEKAEALRKQQEEEARQAEERKRQQEEEARTEEERRRSEARQTDDGDQEAAETSGLLQMPVNTPDFRSANTLQIRLSPYAGQMIGISYGNPSEIQNVKLISVNQDHLQVYYPITKHVVSYPYRRLVQVTENPEGISAVGPDISPVFHSTIAIMPINATTIMPR